MLNWTASPLCRCPSCYALYRVRANAGRLAADLTFASAWDGNHGRHVGAFGGADDPHVGTGRQVYPVISEWKASNEPDEGTQVGRRDLANDGRRRLRDIPHVNVHFCICG